MSKYKIEIERVESFLNCMDFECGDYTMVNIKTVKKAPNGKIYEYKFFDFHLPLKMTKKECNRRARLIINAYKHAVEPIRKLKEKIDA